MRIPERDIDDYINLSNDIASNFRKVAVKAWQTERWSLQTYEEKWFSNNSTLSDEL